MSLLFQIEGMAAKPHPEALLVEPIKSMWERDKSKDKERAIKELTICEFVSSEKSSNPFAGYHPDERLTNILLRIDMPPDWEFDPLCQEVVDFLLHCQVEASMSFTYLQSVKNAANKLKKFFNNFDMNERNERNGNPVFKPAEITRALKDSDDILTNLMKLTEKVNKEITTTERTKGGNIVSEFMKG